MFDKKGFIGVDSAKHTEDEIMELAIELGADDVKTYEDTIEVYTSVNSYTSVLEGLKKKI